jgi:hypothetical protein
MRCIATIALFTMLAWIQACQDSTVVVHEPEPDSKGGEARDTQESLPPGPTYTARQPEGQVPITRNPAATVVTTSNGSGGVTGYQNVAFGAGRYKIEVPADIGPSRPYGLHIHLHGDGGGGFDSFPNRRLANDLIGVAVRAPMTRNPQWGRSLGVEHANYLDGLIQNEILRKYNIRTDRIYFSGVSGGAYFLTGHFIPLFGQKYRSGALILCGGMPPQIAFPDQNSLKDIRMHFITTGGERSDITANIDQSLAAYRPMYAQAGAPTMLTNETVGVAGHCEFDNRSYTTGIQMVIDSKFSTIVKN